tara:strand:+ start:1722 stop:3131 length:1410 start_codon:yes stop_codon:yes gene_type:complete
MSFKKFGQNDILINTMMASPHCEFFIYDGDVFYNNTPSTRGTSTAGGGGYAVSEARMVGPGSVSLYEYNIDRPEVRALDKIIGETGSYAAAVAAQTDAGDPKALLRYTGRIYPWISKDSAGSSWKTINTTGYATEYMYGDVLSGSYPLSASIVRQYIVGGATAPSWYGVGATGSDGAGIEGKLQAVGTGPSGSLDRHFYSLKNRLNFYGARSIHYKVSASLDPGNDSWNKNTQTLNLIAIPSIIFGSQIKPGTVSLKWYYDGGLIGELQDRRENGELIQVSASAGYTTNNNKVAGVILYDEGYIVLTGSWALNGASIPLQTAANSSPTWLYFGVGANDGLTQTNTGANFAKASFSLSFKGQTKTQVMTMFTHAKRGEANFSNNPTYLKYGQDKLQYTSSQVYEENPDQILANTVSSSYSDYNAPFKRSVYISKVAIYDENKNMIGVATLANPVLKEEDQDYSFKIKLDI